LRVISHRALLPCSEIGFAADTARRFGNGDRRQGWTPNAWRYGAAMFNRSSPAAKQPAFFILFVPRYENIWQRARCGTSA
jgi:hypothetical protein